MEEPHWKCIHRKLCVVDGEKFLIVGVVAPLAAVVLVAVQHTNATATQNRR